MAYVISDSCVACGACESQCPVGAISMGTANLKLMQTNALAAVPVQDSVRPALFPKNNHIQEVKNTEKALHQMMEGFFFNPKRTVFFFSSFALFPFLLL